jgi:hypothetical protein
MEMASLVAHAIGSVRFVTACDGAITRKDPPRVPDGD